VTEQPFAPHVKGRVLRWLNSKQPALAGMDPGNFDASAVEETLRWARKAFGPGRYFDLDVRGMERVGAGPVMVVSNHSGGTTIPDVWGFMVAWYEQFGTSRPLHPLAHDMILSTPGVGGFFERRGVLRANGAVATRALREFRHDLLVMPGGDLDTWRPYSERYVLRFGARSGYARTALRAGVPIVPVANAGAHETLYVLTDGKRLARAIGLPSFARSEVFPIHLSLPWGLGIGPLPHVPIPAKLRYRIAERIEAPRAYDDGEDPPEEVVREIDGAVRAAIQRMLDELKAEAAR
jgi:1-acyl-sn-glycerol-3-phosphate acyltransferase